MAETINQLLSVQELLKDKNFEAIPSIRGRVNELRDEIDAELTREIPSHIAVLEQQHGWRGNIQSQLATFDRLGTFDGEGKKGDLMSPKELRNHAPGAGDLIEALKERPALLRKIEQGFTNVELVPFGLSPEALSKTLGKSILHYHSLGKLQSTDGMKLDVDASEPVWLFGDYKGSDTSEKIAYFPKRFDATDHEGQTKQQVIDISAFPGWQMQLTENLRNIPRQGKGQAAGGRPQVEANQKPNEYLALLQSQAYDLESGGTPESWMTRGIMHLAKTDGEVLDDYQSGSACYLLGAWLKSSGFVARAFWFRDYRQARVDGYDPGYRDADVGARFEVRVY